jgi:hypothetical protein
MSFKNFLECADVCSILFSYLSINELNNIYILHKASSALFENKRILHNIHKLDVLLSCPMHAFITIGLMGKILKSPRLHTIKLSDSSYSTINEINVNINRHIGCIRSLSRSVGNVKRIIFDTALSEIFSMDPIEGLDRITDLICYENTIIYSFDKFIGLKYLVCPAQYLPELREYGAEWSLSEFHHVYDSFQDKSFAGNYSARRHDKFWRSLKSSSKLDTIHSLSIPNVDINGYIPRDSLRIINQLSSLTSLRIIGAEQIMTLGDYAGRIPNLLHLEIDIGINSIAGLELEALNYNNLQQLHNLHNGNYRPASLDTHLFNGLKSLHIHMQINNNKILSQMLERFIDLEELIIEYYDFDIINVETDLLNLEKTNLKRVTLKEHMLLHNLIKTMPNSLERLTLVVGGESAIEHMNKLFEIQESISRAYKIVLDVNSISLQLI